MKVAAYPVIRSMGSYLIPKKHFRRPGSGGTFSSEYCYSVWLRHQVCLINSGLLAKTEDLNTVVEIGPGDSFGIGIAALYTGASNYIALDIIKHAKNELNLQMNRELLNYFIERRDIPHGGQFKDTKPDLSGYSFPVDFLNYNSLYYKQRYKEIHGVLNGSLNSRVTIKYLVPWHDLQCNTISDVDLVFSQAVMEQVADIDLAYKKMYSFLKSEGIMSHEIDFKSHEMTRDWNGHWFINEPVWNFLLHGRKYPINRLPLSAHISAIEKTGFTIKKVVLVQKINKYKDLTPTVKDVVFTDGDLITSSALIQAMKE